jgi:hypothetical protein
LKPRTHFDITIQYDLRDSFPGKQFESLLHTTDIKTKRVVLEVNFHKERQPKSAKLFLRFAGQENEMERPVLNAGVLPASIKNPKIGSEFELEWEW